MVAPSPEVPSSAVAAARPHRPPQHSEVTPTVNRYGSVSLGQHIIRAAEILAGPDRRVVLLTNPVSSGIGTPGGSPSRSTAAPARR
jgi:hypothetical protein